MRALLVFSLFIFMICLHNQNAIAMDNHPQNLLPSYNQRGFILTNPPQNLAPLEIFNEKEEKLSLDNFIGKPLLLNLWASWCAPCLTELPSLERAIPQLNKMKIQLIPLSFDRNKETVAETYQGLDIKNLEIWLVNRDKISIFGKIPPLPTTLFINAQGQEIARFIGITEWDSPEALGFLHSFSKGETLNPAKAPLLDDPINQ